MLSGKAGKEGDKVNVLAVNPGSTSTKLAVYSDFKEVWRKTLIHDADMLSGYHDIADQLDFRKKAVLESLKEVRDFPLEHLSAVAARGGLLRPLPGGVYRVNDGMKNDLRTARYGSHASNLGALIADEIASETGVNAFIVDPVVVDEFTPLARYSGIPEIPRKSIFHALNQKATAKRAAKALEKSYKECNLIVAHMGGGTSIGIHEKGRVVDVNNALDGEGPFSIERAGTVPAGDWMRYVLSHSDRPAALQKKLTGRGGVVAYLGTNNAKAIEDTIEKYKKGKKTDELDGAKCLEVMKALCYQISREISSLAAVVSGNVDAVVLTGGLAFSEFVTGEIKGRVSFIAPVMIYPGENELEALASAVMDALRGKEEILIYQA